MKKKFVILVVSIIFLVSGLLFAASGGNGPEPLAEPELPPVLEGYTFYPGKKVRGLDNNWACQVRTVHRDCWVAVRNPSPE